MIEAESRVKEWDIEKKVETYGKRGREEAVSENEIKETQIPSV